MARLIQKEFNVTDGNIKFNIRVKNGFTLINGNSCTGKTYLFNLLAKYGRLGLIENLRCLNVSTGTAMLKDKGKIFVIDNADIILHDSMCRKIARDDNNQYIIFGRDIRRYVATPDNIAELVESNGLIKLRYTFKSTGEQYE